MARKLVDISDRVDDELTRLANLRGQAESEIVERALELYLEDAAVGPEITDPAEVAAIRAEAAGMWKDRTDLPNVRELRSGWGRRMSRLFGDGK